MLRVLWAVMSIGFVLSSAEPALAQSSRYELTIVNRSVWNISQIYMSSSNSSQWGSDLLGRTILTQGNRHRITNIGFGEWDIKFVDEDGDACILNRVRVTQNLSWQLTDDWLLKCEARQRRN
jgi:hypothetical protein